jgi:hypothetical protein
MLACTAAVLAQLAPVALAETVNATNDLLQSPKTAAYMYARPMMENMYRLGVAQDRKFGLQTECKTQYQVKPVSISVLAPIEFPDDKPHPSKGVWNFRYQFERCGEGKVYNAIHLAADNGQAPAVRPYYPGTSNANLVLIKDAMTAALVGAMVRSGLKDCKEIDVFDMKVSEPPHDVTDGGKTLKGVWTEAWTFRLCGQLVEVPMVFTPNPTTGGTNYSTGPLTMGGDKAKP